MSKAAISGRGRTCSCRPTSPFQRRIVKGGSRRNPPSESTTAVSQQCGSLPPFKCSVIDTPRITPDNSIARW